MNKETFLQELAEILMADFVELTNDAELASFGGWDSMGYLGLIALLDDKMGIQLEPGQIRNLKTVGDVIKLTGLNE